MADVLQVEKREQTGSRATERLRRSGRVPAVLYGHGQETEVLSVELGQLKALLRHHGKMVELSGAITDTAMVRDMQWDPLGIEVLHLDLMRVNLTEKVELTVAIHMHGEAVGVQEGGVLVELQHDVEVRCSAGAIPESLQLNVSDLHLDGVLTAADLQLPEGVELLTPGDVMIARVEQVREQEESAEDSGSAEPEVVGRDSSEEDKG